MGGEMDGSGGGGGGASVPIVGLRAVTHLVAADLLTEEGVALVAYQLQVLAALGALLRMQAISCIEAPPESATN